LRIIDALFSSVGRKICARIAANRGGLRTRAN